MEDFDKARRDLTDELRRAPTRRIDNQITQMQSYAERLRLHAFVIDEAAGAAWLLLVLFVELVTLPRAKRRLVERFDEIFEKLHDRELLVRDRAEDLRTMWEEVRPRAREVAERRGLQSFPKMKWADRQVLRELLQEDIPKLRSGLYEALRDAAAPQRAESAAVAMAHGAGVQRAESRDAV
jgi:hypothetical protein